MENINIKGVQQTSLIDYPGNIVSTIFLSRCNFRCPFCHNPELVLDQVEEDIPPEEVIDFLEDKKKWLDGICITGGEPTLHKGLPEFIKKVKSLGMKVKLDTNGTNPEMLSGLLSMNLLDYVSMDIKASPENYPDVTKVRVNMDKVRESIKLLQQSNIEHEFRTTVIPGHFDAKEAEAIGSLLRGSGKYFLQQYRNSDKVLEQEYQNIEPYLADKFEEFRTILLKYIENVEIRGV